MKTNTNKGACSKILTLRSSCSSKHCVARQTRTRRWRSPQNTPDTENPLSPGFNALQRNIYECKGLFCTLKMKI